MIKLKILFFSAGWIFVHPPSLPHMTDSTHWGSGLPHICACGIYSPIRLAYGMEGLGAPQKDPLGWTLTNAYPPTFFNQGGGLPRFRENMLCVYISSEEEGNRCLSIRLLSPLSACRNSQPWAFQVRLGPYLHVSSFFICEDTHFPNSCRENR